jgi:hypothetical protein
LGLEAVYFPVKRVWYHFCGRKGKVEEKAWGTWGEA